MRFKIFALSLACCLVFYCGEGRRTSEINKTDEVQQKTELSATAIEGINYVDFALSAEAESVIVEWEKYQELAIQINYLKKGDLSFFKNDIDLLETFIVEFKDSIPSQFRTNPILSRIAILETVLLKLNDDLTLSNITTDLKLKSIERVLQSFSNLNYQLDKTLERDTYDKITPE